MKPLFFLLAIMTFVAVRCTPPAEKKAAGPSFSISFTQQMSDQAQDGRLMLLLANNDKTEPRNQINFGLDTQLAFGIDVEGMKPGQEIIVDATAFGFPIRSLKDIPAGDYFVQALVN